MKWKTKAMLIMLSVILVYLLAMFIANSIKALITAFVGGTILLVALLVFGCIFYLLFGRWRRPKEKQAGQN